MAHQRVLSNRRVGGQGEDVQFEERPTPRGQNTYMHELTPDDGRLRRRRAKRIVDRRAAADRGPSVGSVECHAAAEEAIEETAVTLSIQAEKDELMSRGVSESDCRLSIREQHAVEQRFELFGYSTDSALMCLWRRRKGCQLAHSGITGLIRSDKPACAKRRSELTFQHSAILRRGMRGAIFSKTKTT